jgi:hypothetical protein
VKKNAYLERQKAAKTDFMNSVELIVKQYCIDTLQITLHEEYGWGYDRLAKLMEQWADNRKKYQEAINPDVYVESDVAQEHMDRIMVQIIKGKQDLIPFAERYPTLKKNKY